METSYKEKYEQAIERLKQWDREHPCAGYVLSDRDKFIFPELAESEEKPNGGIVREDFTQGDGWYKVNLDYLSKAQVEEIEQLVEKWNPKEVSEEEKIKKAILIYLDWLDGKKDYLPKGDYTIKDMILWLEKQGEQKFEMKTAEESLGIDSATYNKIVDECIFGEQKPEENKGNIGGIYTDEEAVLDALIRRLEGEDIHVSPHLAAECLKSLKGRVHSKQEWSDVDKDILFRTINDLKFLRDTISIDPKYAVNIIDMEREITWLKSLRPQNKWKPSNVQMEALRWCVSHLGGVDKQNLGELYEQLMRLKEGRV